MIYAYTRETPGGDTQKEKLKRDEALLKAENPDILVIEKAPNRRKKKFDDFRKIMDVLKPGDTLVVPSFDRISHSADDFSGLLAGLANRGVTLRVLNMGTFDQSEKGTLLRKAVNAFAEFEKAMIVERTQGRKADARNDITYREGRPRKFTRKEVMEALRMLENGSSYKTVSTQTGISISTLRRARTAERARRSGDYSMTDAEIREYEAAVARSEQMTLGDLMN